MVANALEGILKHYFNLSHLFHYLDDFFFVAPALSPDCLNALLDMLLLCEAVGAPVKPEKVQGPATTLTILGIELDTVLKQARLPPEKLTALLEELSRFSSLYSCQSRCTKHQLLSLIGKLAFACKVIPAGRIFLRRLLDTAHSVEGLEEQVAITKETVLDVRWWLRFASDWNRVAFFIEPSWTPAHEFNLFTDATGHLGYGAYWNGHWFSKTWSSNLLDMSIEWKELYAIVMACETWGKHWSGKRLLFHCDNEAVVHVWQAGRSRCPDLMDLVRALFYVAVLIITLT